MSDEQNSQEKEIGNDKMPFTAHLEELRERLIKSSIAVLVGFFAAYEFKEKLFDILIHPLVKVMNKGDTMIYTGLPEAFFVYVKTAFLAGIILASPVLFYQFWMFVAPGLYSKEKKVLFPIIFLSVFFFVGGALFAYFVAFPYGFKFLLEYSTDTLRAMLSMKEYFSLCSQLLLAFGLVFEMPLVLTAMAAIGVISAGFLTKYRKYAILLIFIFAAIITPQPDAVSQAILAVPMMILYEISIIGAKIFGKKIVRDEDEAETSAEAIPENTARSENGHE